MSKEVPTHQAGSFDLEFKDRILKEKIAAIRKQSPNLSDVKVSAQAQDEVDRKYSIWATVNVGPHWHSIEGERQEEMAKWKGQVDAVLGGLQQALDSGDFAGLVGIMKERFHEGDLKNIVEKIVADSHKYKCSFDDEAKKLLSIGLWIWREQGGAWAGERKIIWKILTKDSAKLSSFLDKNAVASCVDISYLIKAMAEQYGIEGEVMSAKNAEPVIAKAQDVTHRYFRTASGKIMDYWWARGTAGLKLSPEAYEQVRKEKRTKRCGT